MKIVWLVGMPSKLDPVDAWVAHMREVKAEVRSEAYAGGRRARGILAAHKPGQDTTVGPSKITVTKGDRLDWFVNLDDKAAGAIEMGTIHMAGIHPLGRAFGVVDGDVSGYGG